MGWETVRHEGTDLKYQHLEAEEDFEFEVGLNYITSPTSRERMSFQFNE